MRIVAAMLFLIGLAGIPDDIRTWGRWIEILGIWLEDWWVKATVALLSAAVMTYPQWLPWLVRLVRRTATGLARMRRRVVTTVDPEQSYVLLMGNLLTVSVFVSIRNLLVAEAQLERVELTIVMKEGPARAVRSDAFQDARTPRADDPMIGVDDVRIGSRSLRRGFFMFSGIRDVRTSEVERFELRMQAVGESLEVHRFDVVDWVDAAQPDGSRIFLVPDSAA